MHPNVKLGSGTIYVSDGKEYKEIGTTKEGYIETEELQEAINVAEKVSFINGQATLAIRPTYKKWFKKKKGKRYVYYYIVKKGFDPKIIKMLNGEKSEHRLKDIEEMKEQLNELIAMCFRIPKEFIKEDE